MKAATPPAASTAPPTASAKRANTRYLDMRVSYLIPRRRDLRRSGRGQRKIDAALMTVQQLARPEDVVAVTVREKTIVIATLLSAIGSTFIVGWPRPIACGSFGAQNLKVWPLRDQQCAVRVLAACRQKRLLAAADCGPPERTPCDAPLKTAHSEFGSRPGYRFSALRGAPPAMSCLNSRVLP
jgi:hypothetical protein